MLIKYFKTALCSTDMEFMAALASEKRRCIETSQHLKYLVQSFSNVVANIDQQGREDRIIS